MIVHQSKQIIAEVNKAFIGKNDIIEKVLMTILYRRPCPPAGLPGSREDDIGACFLKSTWAEQQTYPVYTGYAAVRYYRFYRF